MRQLGHLSLPGSHGLNECSELASYYHAHEVSTRYAIERLRTEASLSGLPRCEALNSFSGLGRRLSRFSRLSESFASRWVGTGLQSLGCPHRHGDAQGRAITGSGFLDLNVPVEIQEDHAHADGPLLPASHVKVRVPSSRNRPNETKPAPIQ
jgi:hypothetical protein